MTTVTALWGKHKVDLTWVPSTTLPEDAHVTSVHGYCFHQERIILVEVDSRGWDVPGGHIEKGETPEQCLAREAMEEAVIDGHSKMLGYVLVDNSVDEHFDPTKYPALGCQVYFRMDVENIYSFDQEYECLQRGAFSPEQIPAIHNNWHIINELILAEALANK